MLPTKADWLGFVRLQLGARNVDVPLRAGTQIELGAELAKFHIDGVNAAILVRADATPKQLEKAIEDEAQIAARHFAKKLLN
jgi:hypothetical protein